jgi:hypothetical protein
MTDGEVVYDLPNNHEDFWDVTNRLLRDMHLPQLEDRVPVLAYGANANPFRLRGKMADVGEDMQEVMQTVPHERVMLPGMAAVWHGRPGQAGSVFAELYPLEQDGAGLQAHVAYLTSQQLAAIHMSEGGTYSAAAVEAQVSGRMDVIPAVAYVALRGSVLLKDDKPVLVKGLKHKGMDLPEMSPAEAVQYMLDSVAGEIGQVDVRDFVREGLKLKLSQKKARQERVRVPLAAQGKSREYSYPVADGELIGRADFASLPGLTHHGEVVLPEMMLADVRPSKEQLVIAAVQEMMKFDLTQAEAYRKVQNRLDPARRVASRAHEELEVRHKLTRKERVARAYAHRKTDPNLTHKEALRQAADDMAKIYPDPVAHTIRDSN